MVALENMKKIYVYIQLLFLICSSLQGQVSISDLDNAYNNEIKAENTSLSARIKQLPANFQALNEQARQAIKNKDYSQALSVAIEMEIQYPANADVKNFKGKMQVATGDKGKAIRSFSEALVLEPGNKWFYINKAAAQTENGMLQDALQTINDLTSRYLEWSIGYNFKAALLHALDKNDEALSAYETAIRNNPKSAQILTNRGDLYLQLGDRTKALQDYNSALAIQPDYQRAKSKINDIAQNTTSKAE
jgi:tetratricopeptide (TPR) repeat protein